MPGKSWMQPVVEAVMPPALFDFWAGRINPAWSWERPLARVLSRQAASRDAMTLVLKPNRHFAGFLPGQHINVGVEVDGVRLVRSYSPAPVAGRPDLLAITVRRVDGGRVSAALCERVRVGDVVELGAAYGDMTLAGVAGPIAFLAAGSGITPFISLLRAQAVLGMPHDISLLYWAGHRDELCLIDELRELAGRFPRFRLQVVLTRDADDPDHGERLDAAQLQRFLPELPATTVLACGPAGFVALAGKLAEELAAGFQGEAFTPPALERVGGELVRVTLARSRRELLLPSGQPLLTALEAQGLKPASGCRMGICNTCACAKLTGASEDLRSGELNGEASAALRICVSAARSDLTLDI